MKKWNARFVQKKKKSNWDLISFDLVETDIMSNLTSFVFLVLFVLYIDFAENRKTESKPNYVNEMKRQIDIANDLRWPFHPNKQLPFEFN